MTSDESLMLQFKAGSRESFEELFARYREPVQRFFRRRVLTQAEAEDLAQETWVAVLKGTLRYEPRAAFRSYLYGIAFKLMAAARRRNAALRAATDISALVAASHSSEADQWVREALDKLDSTDREIIMLREYEQLSYEEIARLLHIPLNTVRSRLFRARLAIKQLLEPNAQPVIAQGRS
jgi:RNA polymerase sigma-70 factor (ECF subfamily)